VRLVTRNSPNQSARNHGDAAVRLVVAHTPEGGYDSTVGFIMRPTSQVSYHLLIRKDGTEATQLVPWHRKAWHAGPVNSLSDGVAVEGFARHFNLADPGTRMLAREIAKRLVARRLPCQWTTDPAKGGFCRHGDLQSDRTDPTGNLDHWRLFVAMVADEHERLVKPPAEWPRPLPAWFWEWARWRLGEGEFKQHGPVKGPRPSAAPRLIPPWAWLRLQALLRARKA
jgi:hypothetical protein